MNGYIPAAFLIHGFNALAQQLMETYRLENIGLSRFAEVLVAQEEGVLVVAAEMSVVELGRSARRT